MIIHGHDFTPSDVRRLIIEHTGPNGTGLLDLTGPAAAAAMRDIARHHRPASGKPSGPKPEAPAVVLDILRSAANERAPAPGLSIADIVAHSIARRAPVSRSRVVAVVRQLVYDGQIERGPDLPQARGGPLHRYRASPPLPPDDKPKRERPRMPDIAWVDDS